MFRPSSSRRDARRQLRWRGYSPIGIIAEVLEDRTLLTTLSVSDVTRPEGDSGDTTFTFDVMLDEAIAEDVTFNFTTETFNLKGFAQAGSDFTPVSGSGRITAGQTATTIEVSILGDRVPESDELFFVDLSNIDAGGLPVEFDPAQIRPTGITEVASYNTPGYALNVQVVGNLAYVADSLSGIRALDLTNPAGITELGAFDTPGQVWDVQVVGDLAYLADSVGLRVLDVSNPAAINEVGFFDTSGNALAVQLVGNLAYVANDESGLRVLDVGQTLPPSPNSAPSTRPIMHGICKSWTTWHMSPIMLTVYGCCR